MIRIKSLQKVCKKSAFHEKRSAKSLPDADFADSCRLLKISARVCPPMWAPVASWNLEQYTEEAVFQEISRIIAASMADAQVSVTPKHNLKAFSHFRLRQVSSCIDLLLVHSCLSESIFFCGRTTSHEMVHTEIESMHVHLRSALDARSSFMLRSWTAKFVC